MIYDTDLGFDFFLLEDGFLIADLISFLEVPHYTNEFRSDIPACGYSIRSIFLPEPNEANPTNESFEGCQGNKEQVLLIWSLEKYGNAGPTDIEVQRCYVTNYSSEDEDVDEDVN